MWLLYGLLLVGFSQNTLAGGAVIGWWQFDDSANAGKDSSLAGNDLMINGNPTVEDGGILLHGGSFSQPKETREFLYSNSSDFDLGNESFTVECWFKSPMITYMNLVGTRNTIRPGYRGQTGWTLGLSKGKGAIMFVVNDNRQKCTWAGIKISESTWDGDEWNHLVGVRDRAAKTIRLYLNGELVDSKDDLCTDITKHQHLKVGIDGYAGCLTEGSLKQIKISKTVLSSQEIAEQYKKYTTEQMDGEQIVLRDKPSVPDPAPVDISDGLDGKLRLQPQPVTMSDSGAYTSLKEPVTIQMPRISTAQQLSAKEMLVEDFATRLNIEVKIADADTPIAAGTLITLAVAPAEDHSESYHLNIVNDDEKTTITLLSSDHGILYGALRGCPVHC
jgi:hypothetical protein